MISSKEEADGSAAAHQVAACGRPQHRAGGSVSPVSQVSSGLGVSAQALSVVYFVLPMISSPAMTALIRSPGWHGTSGGRFQCNSEDRIAASELALFGERAEHMMRRGLDHGALHAGADGQVVVGRGRE